MKVPFLDLGASADELRQELAAASERVLASGWYVLGPELGEFEREFAEYCGAEHCVGVGNGLEALALILLALGVGRGDEVVVPSNTYIATWLAVSWVGAKPVPCEPLETTHNLDPERLAESLTARTRAIIAVHLYGQPAEMAKIADVAARHGGIPVVEDAAQAHGSRYQGTRAGSLGVAAAFSFYPTKNLGGYGDGGAVTTQDAGLADRIRLLRNYGSPRKYVNTVKGWNSRLDELQAALLRVRLRHLDEWNRRRSRTAERYAAGIKAAPQVVAPIVAHDAEPVWHQFVIRHPHRDALAAALGDRGVGTLIHYPIPPHLSEAYAEDDLLHDSLPIATRLANQVLSLPIGPELDTTAVETVINAVVDACRGLDQ